MALQTSQPEICPGPALCRAAAGAGSAHPPGPAWSIPLEHLPPAPAWSISPQHQPGAAPRGPAWSISPRDQSRASPGTGLEHPSPPPGTSLEHPSQGLAWSIPTPRPA